MDAHRPRGWLALVALACGAGCGGATVDAGVATTPAGPSILVTPAMGSPHPGEPAPDFELPNRDGIPVRLSSFRGHPVVLTFVTSWCPFSAAAQPHLAALARDYAERGVQVVAVDIEETDEGYARYLGRVDMPFPVLRDARGEHVTAFVPEGAQPSIEERWKVIVSSYLVIDASGVIRFFTLVDTAAFDAELVHVRRALDGLLAEAGT